MVHAGERASAPGDGNTPDSTVACEHTYGIKMPTGVESALDVHNVITDRCFLTAR